MTATRGPWRRPAEESSDLYPDLVIHDGRVSGSITVGASRLPLWAFVSMAIHEGWDDVEAGWEPTERYGYTADDLSEFLHDLLQARGEFARLLLVLADAERCDMKRSHGGPWWHTKRHRRRVADQLRRCLASLEEAT